MRDIIFDLLSVGRTARQISPEVLYLNQNTCLPSAAELNFVCHVSKFSHYN